MKPIYLEMNYFGPHEYSQIDFRELDDAPLFLISGDTGAGKSTIFDAMTYALFGTTTGDREAKEMRSQFAQPNQLTEVTFYFEQGNFLYKVTRQPEQEVFKKKGTGTKSVKTQANLAIVDEVFGLERAILASKAVDVASEIYNLLNLTADQFKKIILLPQNDFSRFLKSATNEKEEILKKIFGTAVFTEFSEEIRHQYTTFNQANEKYETALRSQHTSSVWTDKEIQILEEVPENEKFDAAKAFLTEKKRQEEHAQAQAKLAQQKVEELEKNYEAALMLEQSFAEQEKTKKEYEEKISEQANFYQKQKEEYEAQLWASQLKEVYRNLEELQKSLVENQRQEEIYRLNAAKEKTALDDSKKREAELKTQNDHFAEKKARIEELSGQIPRAEQAEKLAGDKINLEKKLEKLGLEINSIDKPYKQAETNIKKAKAQVLDEEMLRTEKEKLNRIELEFQSKLSPLADNVQRVKKEMEEARQVLQSCLEDAESFEQNLQKKRRIYLEKRNLRQVLMIAQLQKELEEGCPCKVCGAVEHPLAKQVLEVSDEELKEAMVQVDKAQEAFAAAEERQGKAQRESESARKKVSKKTAEYEEILLKLEESYKQFCQTHERAFSQKYDAQIISTYIEKAQQECAEKSEKNKTIKDEILAQEVILEKLRQERQEKYNEAEKLKAQIETVCKSLADLENLASSQSLSEEKNQLSQEVEAYRVECQELREKVNELERLYAEQKAKHGERTMQIKEQKIKLQKYQKHIEKTLTAPNAWTNDWETLKNWLEKDRLPELSKYINNYELEKKRLSDELAKQEKKLGQAKRPNLQEIRVQKQAHNEAYDHLQKAAVEIEYSRIQLQTTVEKIGQILELQGKEAVRGHEITKLYNAVSGKSADKLKLETFVVQHYLEKVLDYANAHFINQLSNNRYRFELARESVNRRRDHGLDISIYDNETGASRSSNTLSGGETFIAALSIALALSEVVQNSARGVQIEALFIDEGFGSLDQETLQKAMSALEQIGENRLVGLISHVEEMKDAIAQQLLIEKLGDGRSRVQLFSK